MSGVVDRSSSRAPKQDSVRQHHHSGLCRPPWRYKGLCSSAGGLSLVGGTSCSEFLCCVHSRCRKLIGGLTLVLRWWIRRVVSAQTCFVISVYGGAGQTGIFWRPLSLESDTLVVPWSHYRFIYVLPPLKVLPHLLRMMEAKRIPVIRVAPQWTR